MTIETIGETQERIDSEIEKFFELVPWSKMEIYGDGSIRTHDQGECPICAVYGGFNHTAGAAAVQNGMRRTNALDIMTAADLDERYLAESRHKKIRQRMLALIKEHDENGPASEV